MSIPPSKPLNTKSQPLPTRKPHNIHDVMIRPGAMKVLTPDGNILSTGPHIDKTPKYISMVNGKLTAVPVVLQKAIVGATPVTSQPIVISPPVPSDIGSLTDYTNNTLFSYGSDTDRSYDCEQWQWSDCFYDAILLSIAIECPWVRQYLCQKNSDNTFNCNFNSTGRGKYTIKVNGQLGNLGDLPNPYDGAIWFGLMEKSYAYFRYYSPSTNASPNLMSSLNYGDPGISFGDIGFPIVYLQPGSPGFITALLANLANKLPLVGTTAGQTPDANIIPAHCYQIYDVQQNGVGWNITIVNPWGINSPGGQSFTVINLQQLQQNFLSVVAVQSNPYTKPTLRYDTNNDMVIDVQDLNAVTSHWQQIVQINTDGDVSGPSGVPDGKVDIQDLNTITSHWQENISGVIAGTIAPTDDTIYKF